MVRRSVVLAVIAAAVWAASANAAPLTLPGWPVPAPTGSVHQGPGGGVVVIGDTSDADRGAVVAFQRNGTLRWVNTKSFDCGNCEPPVRHAAQLQPNRTYGPIGRSGFWAVNQTGLTVPGCDGVVEANGTCFSFPVIFRLPPGGTTPQLALVASRAGTPIWTYFEPNFAAFETKQVVRDQAGGLYASYESGFDSLGAVVPRRLVALDRATGAFKWRQPGVTALAPMNSGVIAGDGHQVIAFAADGHELWRSAGIGRVVTDTLHNRVYVDTDGFGSYGVQGRQVIALNGSTGARLWSTPASEASRLLSVDSRGRALIAATSGRGHSVRAVDLVGRSVWRYPTTSEVVGARELVDGTVAVSLSALLTRIDPRRAAPVVRTARFSLSRSRIPVSRFRAGFPACMPTRCDFRGLSTTLKIQLARSARLTLTLREPSGRVTPNLLHKSFVFDAPTGISFVRFFDNERFIPNGLHFVDLRWRDVSGRHRRLLPLTTV